MADIASLSAFLGSIKTATDIVKAIRGADLSLEKAEVKLKLADVIESLADAKMHAAEIRELIQTKDEKISELERALEWKSKLIRQNGAYYETDENGALTGDPYCPNCWEVKFIAVHLVEFPASAPLFTHRCPNCQMNYTLRK